MEREGDTAPVANIATQAFAAGLFVTDPPLHSNSPACYNATTRNGANQARGARGIVVVYSSAPKSMCAAYCHICIIVANESTASRGSSLVRAV